MEYCLQAINCKERDGVNFGAIQKKFIADKIRVWETNYSPTTKTTAKPQLQQQNETMKQLSAIFITARNKNISTRLEFSSMAITEPIQYS
jgi:hypothetical protein